MLHQATQAQTGPADLGHVWGATSRSESVPAAERRTAPACAQVRPITLPPRLPMLWRLRRRCVSCPTRRGRRRWRRGGWRSALRRSWRPGPRATRFASTALRLAPVRPVAHPGCLRLRQVARLRTRAKARVRRCVAPAGTCAAPSWSWPRTAYRSPGWTAPPGTAHTATAPPASPGRPTARPCPPVRYRA
jgi:hypothetical protein